MVVLAVARDWDVWGHHWTVGGRHSTAEVRPRIRSTFVEICLSSHCVAAAFVAGAVQPQLLRTFWQHLLLQAPLYAAQEASHTVQRHACARALQVIYRSPAFSIIVRSAVYLLRAVTGVAGSFSLDRFSLRLLLLFYYL